MMRHVGLPFGLRGGMSVIRTDKLVADWFPIIIIFYELLDKLNVQKKKITLMQC